MKYTYLEPNSKFSKEWADYTKSWQLLIKKQQKLKRHLTKKIIARHSVPARPAFSVFSVQDIKKAAINHFLYPCNVMKKT